MNKTIVPVVVAVITDDRGRFLMTKRVHLDPEDYKIYHNAWQIPGGGIEFGEKPEESMIREMKEELGSDVQIIRLLPKIYTEVRKNWQGIFIVYICKLKSPDTKIVLNEEASEYGWFTLDQAKKLKTLPGTIKIMLDTLTHKS